MIFYWKPHGNKDHLSFPSLLLYYTLRAISPTVAAVERRESEREKSRPFVKVSGNNETSFVTDVENEGKVCNAHVHGI